MHKTLLPILLTALLVSCNNTKQNETPSEEQTTTQNEEKNLTPLEQGQELALQAQGELAKNLMAALNKDGAEGAISFCNAQALTITQKAAQDLGVSLKRVSDLPRNPENEAGPAASGYIAATKLILEDGLQPKPFLYEEGDKQFGFYPIIANDMCMQCHGDPATAIAPGTLAKLTELYPNDLATGYKPGDLRGVWVVELTNLK